MRVSCLGLRSLLLFLVGWMVCGGARADVVFRNFDDPDAPQWVEEEAVLPSSPKDENLREFYVSELTRHRFFIDASTLHVGKDGVVRYVLVLRTGGGATNVTLEGIRCSSREFKIYASGHRDGHWTKSRQSQWRPIENKPMNRHHAALWRDLFCPGGVPIRTPEEGREALRLGKHPEAV
jgi:hypothetical protein